MELLEKRLANLLCIKSLVTLVSAVVFAALSLRGDISGDQFVTVFTVIVGFYFGTQAKKDAGV